MAIIYKAEVDSGTVSRVAVFDTTSVPSGFETWIDCPDVTEAGWSYDGQVFAPPAPATKTPQELEADVQSLADELTQNDERLMALALATVDLKRADTTSLTLAETRTAFRDRVVYYLRQRRGL